MAKTAFILLIGVACALAAPSSDLGWRIVGGSNADDGQFPHQISLRVYGSHICGGSIIDETTILCAAHCVEGADYPMTVVTGTNKLNSGGDIYDVQKVIVHPNYNGFDIVNDISIIKLATAIKFDSKVKAIELEDAKTGGGEDCVLSGWGTTSYPGSAPNDLQFINLKTYDIDACKKVHASDDMKVFDTEICTLTQKGQGACHGDSGGPLVSTKTGKQIGIVSWGRPCAVGKPDVFTRVESYLDWINANK